MIRVKKENSRKRLVPDEQVSDEHQAEVRELICSVKMRHFYALNKYIIEGN